MPRIENVYTAVNVVTGERLSGTAKELGEIFKCRNTYINRCELTGHRVQGKWKILKRKTEGR